MKRKVVLLYATLILSGDVLDSSVDSWTENTQMHWHTLSAMQDKYLQGRATRLKRILAEATAVADLMAAAAGGCDDWRRSSPPSSIESPAVWGVAEDGAPPTLRVWIKALDERLINAMQVGMLPSSSAQWSRCWLRTPARHACMQQAG